MATVNRRAIFVSWCPPNLLRPRTVQVGRVAKAIRHHGWEAELMCADISGQIEDDLFDRGLAALYAPAFSVVHRFPEPDYFSHNQTEHGTGPAWYLHVAKAITEKLRSEGLKPVISFAQPWTSHLAVLEAKRHNPNLYWIAHFSDPWTDNPYYYADNASAHLHREQERAVIESADAVVFVTDAAADLVMRKYPAEWRAKTHAIPHMCDYGLIETLAIRDAPPAGRIRLLHSGSLYMGRRAPEGLFTALNSLRQRGLLTDEIEVRFVGDMPDRVAEQLDALNLRPVVTSTGALYYIPSMREMSAAHAMLSIDANFSNSPFLPSKVADYLMFDKPIIGLTPKGSPTSLFLESLGYIALAPDNLPAIEEMLLSLVRRGRAGLLDATEVHKNARAAHDTSGPLGERYAALLTAAMTGAAS